MAQAAARGLANGGELSRYERVQRIPLRFDQLGREQLETLSATTGISQQDVLRLALRALIERASNHSPAY